MQTRREKTVRMEAELGSCCHKPSAKDSQKLGEARRDSSLEPLQAGWPCLCPDFRLLASTTARMGLFFIGHLVFCYDSPRASMH